MAASLRADDVLYVALTADVDPDANRPVPGRPDAVSPSGEATYDACAEGLDIFLGFVEGLRLPATIFWEARALRTLAARDEGLIERAAASPLIEHGCHGLEHEDFTGKRTGVPLGPQEVRDRLERAGEQFRAVFGRAPQAFRAPYCEADGRLMAVLAELGYTYDASRQREPSDRWPLKPYRAAGLDLWEAPVCRTRDVSDRPISSYLWQLFEGNRVIGDYLNVISLLQPLYPDGLLQIGLHPWHLVVNAEGERYAGRCADAPHWQLARFLGELVNMAGLEPTTVGQYLADRSEPGRQAQDLTLAAG